MKASQINRIPLDSTLILSLTFTCHGCWLSCEMLSGENVRCSPKIAPMGGGGGYSKRCQHLAAFANLCRTRIFYRYVLK